MIVVVKHRGKRHDVELEPNTTGELFKIQLYSMTGVEPDRQKILVKGSQLKDSTDLSSLGLKAGQVLMMMGTPSSDDNAAEAIRKPKEVVRFLEDMTEAEAAKAEGATPSGLQNLGNTCYLNSTLQTFRAIPELQQQLKKYQPSASASFSRGLSATGDLEGSAELTTSLRDLYRQMSETQSGFPPFVFLNTLRTVFPQFAQRSKTGDGFAQQDAEEAWSQILSRLRRTLQKPGSKSKEGPATSDSSTSDDGKVSFVDKYFAGKFETVTECDDPVAKEKGEEAVNGEDTFLKLDCHIGLQTNHLRDGILAGLDEKIEKRSSTLEQDVTYTKRSRISRLPKYLTVHFVRFYWKRKAQKKAKILRKVTFPSELDVVEFCTEQLKHTLIPIRDKIRDVRSNEQDVERARKRKKRAELLVHSDDPQQPKPSDSGGRVGSSKESTSKEEKRKKGDTVDQEMSDVPPKTDAEIEAERLAAISGAKQELLDMVDPVVAADDSVNKTGLYELRGVITHQGASADSGHYTAYIKKDEPKDTAEEGSSDSDGKWWWFNDDKVSEVDAEKIEGLSGGGT